MEIINEKNIFLNQKIFNKDEAINFAGSILFKNGYVTETYIKQMHEREKVTSTYIGNHIAVPHGVDGSDSNILNSGISFIQVPDGVEFEEGNIAYIIIGIAGKNNTHLEILSKIALVCSDLENVHILRRSTNKKDILKILSI